MNLSSNMTEKMEEKSAKQYLKELETLLCRTLPQQIKKQPRSSMAEPEANIFNNTTVPMIHVDHDESADDAYSNPERAPLLYLPMAKAALPVRTKVVLVHESEQQTSQSCTDKPRGLRFCPLLAVVKLPYRYLGQAYMQAIATTFFDGGKIWNREWELYYIWHTEHPTSSPVIFIEVGQMQELVNEINAMFPELGFKLTEDHESRGLVISFPHTQQLLGPVWLGVSKSRQEYDDLVNAVKDCKTSAVKDVALLREFQESVDLAVCAGKGKHYFKTAKQDSTTPDAKHITAKPDKMAAQLVAARGYLSIGVEQSQPSLTVPDREKPDVVFLAIDCEAYERDSSKITEVGIAMLDTRNILGIAPDKSAVNWHQLVSARHFRIKEYCHLVNKDFIKGRPEEFDFGHSEIVSIEHIASVLADCFKLPQEDGVQEGHRKIVLVGHDISQDIAFCHKIGFSILNRSSIVEVLDTASMFRAYAKESNPRSLASIMYHFHIDAWHLHNAGNDATYTLFAMLAICVDAFDKDSTPSRLNPPSDKSLDS